MLPTFSATSEINMSDWLYLLLVFLKIAAILGSNRIETHRTKTRQEPPKNFLPGFYAVRPEKYFLKGLLPQKECKWFINNIPFIDFPDDQDILTAYYYRWKMYKKHIRFIQEKNIHVVTEFLPDVPWSGEYNTIPAAAGHHIMEGRWIHDERILNDYIQFWFSDSRNNATAVQNPNLSSYTNWIGHASWHRYLLNGNATFVKSLLNSMVTTFRDIYVPKYLKEILWNGTTSNTSESKNQQVVQCWWQNDGYDAMEVSISGNGCRPTIASVLYGEAETIVKLSDLVDGENNPNLKNEFTKWQELSRSLILNYHWNPDIQTFAVIPTVFDDHIIAGTSKPQEDSNCDLSNVRVPNRTVQVRELLAFIPWYFDSLIPKERTLEYLPMWTELFDPNGFSGEWGLRTAELRHPCYNYSYDHGDCWNGPSWPYETSRVLTGLANLINRNSSAMDNQKMEQYVYLLRQYARQHTKTFAVNDTAVPNGSGHIFENLHADLGYWNNRQRMYSRNDENKNMGDDYNHSTYIDLVLSGLLGIRPQEDGSIHIRPLLSPMVSGFAVDHVNIRGKILTLVWDRDGTMYDTVDQGLTVLIDGVKVSHSSTIELLEIPLHVLKETHSHFLDEDDDGVKSNK